MKKTEKLISAADANRRFSEILRGVRDGQTFTVTVHGKPVARVVPAGRDRRFKAAARKALFARLDAQPAVDVGSWTRDELHEDEPIRFPGEPHDMLKFDDSSEGRIRTGRPTENADSAVFGPIGKPAERATEFSPRRQPWVKYSAKRAKPRRGDRPKKSSSAAG